MAVPGFQVDYRLCLNGHAIPVETKDMFLVDPLNLAETYSLDLPDSTEVNLVSFKASGDMNWLCKSLQLPGGDGTKCSTGRWWAHNSIRVPLLMEIKEAIKNLKQLKLKQTRDGRLPTDHHCLILLEIRGQLLYVRNSSASVTLGLAKETGGLPFCSKDIGEPSTPRDIRTLMKLQHRGKIRTWMSCNLWFGSAPNCRRTLMRTFSRSLNRRPHPWLQNMRIKCKRSWRS